MNGFICPICRQPLQDKEKSCYCPNRHCFDKSKSGYINLLMSQKSKHKRHGDDKAMVNARAAFLDSGFYENLRNALLDAILPYAKKGCVLLDAGCGECYYTDYISKNLAKLLPDVYGIDISKAALELAAKRCPDIKTAVASIYNIPMGDKSVDVLLNVFAPHSETEYCRVLKKGGIMVRAVPLSRHLYKLKEAVYDSPYLNKPTKTELNGFRLLGGRELKQTITLCNNADILALFKMTPYYHKTSPQDMAKLLELDFLETETEFMVLTYQKI